MAALKFSERHQGDSESFKSFVKDLKILVKDCGYQEEERMVRDTMFSVVNTLKCEKLLFCLAVFQASSALMFDFCLLTCQKPLFGVSNQQQWRHKVNRL